MIYLELEFDESSQCIKPIERYIIRCRIYQQEGLQSLTGRKLLKA